MHKVGVCMSLRTFHYRLKAEPMGGDIHRLFYTQVKGGRAHAPNAPLPIAINFKSQRYSTNTTSYMSKLNAFPLSHHRISISRQLAALEGAQTGHQHESITVKSDQGDGSNYNTKAPCALGQYQLFHAALIAKALYQCKSLFCSNNLSWPIRETKAELQVNCVE